MTRFLFMLLVLVRMGSSGYAQHFQFSQYNFTPLRINPALAASSNYASAAFLYRNQSTGGGFNLNSNIVNAAYPLFSPRGTRWAGVGLSLMDDRAGQAGIFNTQEVALSYAVNVSISKSQTLSLGVNALHSRRRFDLSGLFTGAQYIEDRGFDGGMGHGEPLGDLENKFYTFSSGINWQQEDRDGNRVASLGISFFDFNKPNDSFLGQSDPYASSLVVSGDFLAYRQNKLMVLPGILYTRTSGRNVLNAGTVTSYEIRTYKQRPSDKIDLITRYVVGRSGIVGVQFHRENISLGLSYDFPVIRRNVANTGTVEAGIALRRLIDPKEKIRKRNQKERERLAAQKKSSRPQKPQVADTRAKPEKDTTKAQDQKNRASLSERLRVKKDSVEALASHGKLAHEPLILEETTLRFGFDFNRSELDVSSKEYLDELAIALNDNADLHVELTGHTDNIGSDKFNMRLSRERAETLKTELVARGVAEERIVVKGKGMREPLNGNLTDEQRAENRRVEMKIYYTE